MTKTRSTTTTLALLSLWTSTLFGTPVISEFLADNDSIAVPGASPQLFVDWVEIHNPSSSTVDLSGWHLTDDPNQPGQWNFPAGTNLAPGGYLVVFADSQNTQDAQGFFHTNFGLSAGGDFLALTRPDESIVSSFSSNGTNYPPQREDISFGLDPADNSPVFFPIPTPGSSNNSTGINFASAPNFSVNHGVFDSPFTVVISADTANATIYFTTDSEPPLNPDGTPSPSASIYTNPLNISTTTVLRATTTSPNTTPSSTTTQTYIFPESVAAQNIPTGYPTSWGAEPNADYEVDPDIAQSPIYADRFRQGLRELPTISVSGKLADIFGPDGIYSRTTTRGLEVPVSAEYFEPSNINGVNNNDGFQLDCGFRIQGGGSRQPDRSIKHSLSLRFRAALGPGRLDFPIFEDASDGRAEESFNSLQLRSIFQNSWVHVGFAQRERATYIQDQWMRDSFIAMGNIDGGFGKFVNVYINGLFWGVYNLHERLDNDHYADYHGFDADEITGFSPRDQSGPPGVEFDALRETVLNGTWQEIANVLEIDQYIDFVIAHQFGDNDDLRPNSNLRLAGGGSANAIWRLYLWDVELTLQNEANTVLRFTDDGVDFLSSLERFPEFRRRFADRAYMHLFNNGALTNLNNRNRFLRYVNILDIPIVGESARWGDDRSAIPFNRDENWQTAVFGNQTVTPTRGVLGGFFPTTGINRTDRIISAWQTRAWDNTPNETWLPAHSPPGFSLAEGSIVDSGNQLFLTDTVGTTFFTLDGSDPADGAGIVYNGGPIPLTESGIVRVRSFENSQFSVLSESSFIVEQPASSSNLVISEVHYNPLGSTDTAFIEIQNTSNAPINLLGTSFTDGVSFTFTSPLTLAPGAYLVLAEDSVAFEARYGFTPAGIYSGSLSRRGERVALNTSSGDLIDELEYDDSLPWSPRADGEGSSLEFTGSPIYQASSTLGGTPGAAPAVSPGIVINEVLAHSESPLLDTIELHNTTDNPVNLSGWFLTDNPEQPQRFEIPNGTTISPGGFLTFDESDFNSPQSNPIVSYTGSPAAVPTTVTISGTLPPNSDLLTISGYSGIGEYNGTHEITVTGPNTFTIPVPFLDNSSTSGTWTPGVPFGLSASRGETLVLTTTNAERISDSVTFEGSLAGEAFARYPDLPSGILVPASQLTLGAANLAPPAVNDIRITEIFYTTDGMYIEIHNTSDSTQSLENWTIRGNADFDFAPGDSLAPGETALIAADPSAVLNAPAGTQIFGPWESGDTLLGVNGGVVRLRRPDTSLPPQGTPPAFTQVIEDEVAYQTISPWPTSGTALQRELPNAPGSSPNSWSASSPTPGSVDFANAFAEFVAIHNLSGLISADPDGDGIPDLGEYALGLDPNQANLPPLGPIIPGTTPTFTVDPLATGVIVTLEASEDLIIWDSDPDSRPRRLFYRLLFTEE